MNAKSTVIASLFFSVLTCGCDVGSVNDEGRTGESLLPAAQSVTIAPQFFGQHWQSPTAWPTISFGAGKFGPGVEWSEIEKARGTYDFSALDAWIAASKLAGHGQEMTFMYSIIHTPDWAGGMGNPSSDLERSLECQAPLAGVKTTDCSLKEYLVSVLDHVCTGTAPHKTCAFTSWELHNEVNVSDAEWSGTYAELAHMDADAIATIKSQCATCTVLGSNVSAGGDGYHALQRTSPEWDVFLTAYLEAWPVGAAMPDALSWHPYPSHDNLVNIPFPETDVGSDCPAPTPNKTCRQTIVKQAQMMRQIADSFPGMKGKPIWATEGGFTEGELTNADPVVQNQLRAAYIARYLLALASGGVQREFWYEWDDAEASAGSTDIAHLWGTEFADGHATPLGVASQQVYDWIAGKTFEAPCSNGGTGTVWTCDLTGAGGLVEQVVWNTAGDSSYAVPASYRYSRALSGPTKSSLAGHSPQIGIEPIVLLNQ